jgi:hypothetical protein
MVEYILTGLQIFIKIDMDPIYIEKSKTTPKVILDKNKEIFHFEGRSLPENAVNFYEPIINWITEYLENPNPTTVLTFELDYFNSSSSKVIFQIIQLLEPLLDKGFDAKVNWRYHEEDEDTLESGQTYANLIDVPFMFSEKQSSS